MGVRFRNYRTSRWLAEWKVIVITDTFTNPLSEERIVARGHGLVSPGFACYRGRVVGQRWRERHG